MKDIAVSKADFEGMIKSNMIYVDKTNYLYKIINSKDPYYFLARPRRFGKSLTLSTLKAIFEGKKELFNGLYIENTDWEWAKYPIIHLDFNSISSKTSDVLKNTIDNRLKEYAKENEIILDEIEVENKFYELIKKFYAKYQKGVVFLVDEYDKPIVDHLGTEEELKIAKENREFIKSFYNNLKALEPYLKTVFITGVSKFSKVSIFSTLNNLIELDTHVDYAAILGYTEEELGFYFENHFEEFANRENISVEEVKDKFKKMYNGFRFTKNQTKVYNPFSIARAFYNKELGNYWFESGTPTFLMNLIKLKEYDFKQINESPLSLDDIKAYDIETLHITALLYQTGYLTIKDYKLFGEDVEILLDFPNREVEKGFFNQLLTSYVEKSDFSNTVITGIRKALLAKDFDKVIVLIKSIFAGIPYMTQPSLKKKKSITDYEFHYHNIFYVIITLLSDWILKIKSEVVTSKGRIDCVIEIPGNIYIIEFKCNQNADEAINQIKTNGYFYKYNGRDENINIIGINFSSELRNIYEWKMERI